MSHLSSNSTQHNTNHSRGNSQEFTNKVITLWYRPPELLLGATKYGTAVDIWSAGCILAELVLGRPLFTGKSEMEQLQLIFDMVGTPTKSSWPGIHELKLLRTGDVTIDGDTERKRPKLRERYSQKMNAIAPGSINLIEKLLELDPSKRLSASRALNHRYFLSEPKAPDQPEQLGYEMDLAVDGSFHEFQTKKKRKEAKIEADKIKQAALDGGHSSKQAQEEYDAIYRGIMEQVAREGLNYNNATTTNTNTNTGEDTVGVAATAAANTDDAAAAAADDDAPAGATLLLLLRRRLVFAVQHRRQHGALHAVRAERLLEDDAQHVELPRVTRRWHARCHQVDRLLGQQPRRAPAIDDRHGEGARRHVHGGSGLADQQQRGVLRRLREVRGALYLFAEVHERGHEVEADDEGRAHRVEAAAATHHSPRARCWDQRRRLACRYLMDRRAVGSSRS